MARTGGPEIALRLNTAAEMFVLAQTDLFSEFRNYFTGVEYCLSVLRSRPLPGRVHLELSLPPPEIDDGAAARLSGALRRYCDHRIRYNERERRALRLDGISSLRIGVPIVVLGYLLVIFTSALVGRTGNTNLVFDTTGWVLVWVGAWYPLDTIFFSPLGYGRENHALRRLRDAEISVVPWRSATVR